MIPDCGIDVHRVSEFCSAAISYAANFTLLLLIVFRTSKELKVYGRVLLVNCIVDLVYTTTSFVIEAHWLVNDGMLFIIHNGFIRTSSPDDTFFLTGIYLWPLYIAILSVTIPFIYRYCLLCRNYILSGPAFGILLLFSIVFASTLPLSCRLYLYADMQRAFATDPNVTDRLACKHAGQIPYMNMDFTLETLIPVSVAAMITAYTYTIVCFCSYKIWKKLKSQAGTMSRRTVSLNNQLNSMLLVQALSPFAVIVIPLFMTCAVIYNGTKNADSLAYVTTALSWIPVTSPISTMYFVKEYRNTILTVVRLRKARTSHYSDGGPDSNSQTTAHHTALRIPTIA